MTQLVLASRTWPTTPALCGGKGTHLLPASEGAQIYRRSRSVVKWRGERNPLPAPSGQEDKAKTYLARLHEAVKEARWGKDEESQGFLREAEEMQRAKSGEKVKP